MKPANPRPKFSWMPLVSQKTILTLTALADRNILLFAEYDGKTLIQIGQTLIQFPELRQIPPLLAQSAAQILNPIRQEITAGPHIARFTGLVILGQLHLEVLDMILNRIRHKLETEAADANGEARGRAQGKSEGRAEGIAEGRAQLAKETQAWFTQYQQDPSSAPPPPFLNGPAANGKNPDQGYSL